MIVFELSRCLQRSPNLYRFSPHFDNYRAIRVLIVAGLQYHALHHFAQYISCRLHDASAHARLYALGMTSADDAPSTNDLNLNGKKTLTKRLGTFFSTKPNHIGDHYIELDEPHRHYGPGDAVKGQVALKIARPLGVTHVVISLSGFVSVSKQQSALKIPARLSNERAGKRGRRWASEYYGDGFASLFEEEIVLCGEGRLDPRFYKFRFEIAFPTTLKLPSSIDVSHPRWSSKFHC